MKWGATKQARQQIKRMSKIYKTNAAEVFLNAQKAIQESGMSRKEKSAAIERAANRYLESGMSTKSGIWGQFNMLLMDVESVWTDTEGGGYDVQRAISEVVGTDVVKAAQYLEGTEKERRLMDARHYAGSSVIQYVADAQKAGTISTQAFYDILGDVDALIQQNDSISPDKITSFINELIQERY